MGLIIEDGHGTGKTMRIVEGDKAFVKAVTTTEEQEINHDHGDAYHLVVSQSPTAADDAICYIENSSDVDMIIEGITIAAVNATADDSIYFKLGDVGTRNSGSAVTPVNTNSGSGKTATGTFEKGADLDGGSATLTGGAEVDRLVLAGETDQISAYYNFQHDFILPKNKTLTTWIGGSATGTWSLTFVFNYHDKV